MKKMMMGVLTILLCSGMALAQRALPEDLAYKIKNEGFQRSQIGELAFWMTDYAGDRLTGSQKWVRSEALVVEKLKSMGFQNVRAEEAMAFTRGGWDNQKTYVAMTAPYYCHFFGIPRAWTGSAKVSGEVILFDPQSMEDVKALEGKLAGKIILMPSTATYEMSFEPLASRYTDEELANLAKDPRPSARRAYATAMRMGQMPDWQMQARALLQSEKPAVIVSGSGSFNVPRSSGGNYRSGDPEPVAELVLPIEAHGRMLRLVRRGIPVSMEIDIQNVFSDNNVVNNIIAEIPGTDPKLKDEVVLIGGHFDSWHGGTGAADNASGCIVMAEALRIIKESGIQPRRTIRLALWGGEEQGLFGSRGYVQNELYDVQKNVPKKGFEQFALYLNMDNGSGKFRGIYLEENDMALPFMQVWTKALQSMGFETLTLRRTGGTDHQSFDRYGLPAYQFIQDELEYGRGYHTPMDTFERLSLTDLTYNAVVAAWIALSAAMDDQKIPRKPVTIAPPRPMR